MSKSGNEDFDMLKGTGYQVVEEKVLAFMRISSSSFDLGSQLLKDLNPEFIKDDQNHSSSCRIKRFFKTSCTGLAASYL
ncbi:hypothetical protein TNCV_3803951 [Trichonephila clavipes]|nr:hypothetical protein TNCV_3803951 [Trichonephila clavipes]